jgi:hypothetical protein
MFLQLYGNRARNLGAEGCFWDEHAFRTSKQHFLDRTTIRRLGKQWQ